MRNPRKLAIAVTAVGLVFPLVAVGAALPAPTAVGASPMADQLLRTQHASIKQAVAESSPLTRGATVRAAIEVEVARGMHVNANPPTYDWLIPVEVSVDGVEGVSVTATYYPEAEHRKFPYDEKPFAVYEGTFIVALELEVTADAALGAKQLRVVLDYQACNDEACFAPTQTTLDLPMTVAVAGTPSTSSDSPLLKRAPFPER